MDNQKKQNTKLVLISSDDVVKERISTFLNSHYSIPILDIISFTNAESILRSNQGAVVILDLDNLIKRDEKKSLINSIKPFCSLTLISSRLSDSLISMESEISIFALKPLLVQQNFFDGLRRMIDGNRNWTQSKKVESDRIGLAVNKKLQLLTNPHDVIYFEAAHLYCNVFLSRAYKKKKEFLVFDSIGHFEKILDSEVFFRIHKKYIVNRHHIKSIDWKVRKTVDLSRNFTVEYSRRRKKAFEDWFNSI